MLADTDLKGICREVLLECYLIPTAEAESDEDVCGLKCWLFDPPTLHVAQILSSTAANTVSTVDVLSTLAKIC
jgi:hypothetical protein